MSDRPIRVLVVDDDLATRLLACEALAADGFEAVEAEDGQDGLDQYHRCAPDAVLLDVNMPRLDGYEVCRRIRQLPGGVATSIMVMTATDDVDAVQRAFAAGATDFLTKPLNLPLLAHRVRYMLRAAATATAARETAARLARAQRLARLVHWQVADGMFAWTGDPLDVFWPDAPADRAPHTDLLSLVHPEDRDRVAAMMAVIEPHQLDYRIQLPDGTVRSVHQDADVDVTDRGNVLIGATQDITEIKHAEEQISQLAFYDDLTGIPNRQFVDRHLRTADPSCPRFAILIDLGLSHLDRLPRPAHDALIRAATARVIERVRGGDLQIRLDQVPLSPDGFGGQTLVAWMGNDQLVVISTGGASPTTLARTLSDAMLATFPIGGRELTLRPRFGVAAAPDPVAELQHLVELAATAALEAERTAPRDVVVFSEQVRDQRMRRADLARHFVMSLDLAVREAGSGQPGELSVDYAPRREPGTRRLVGVRARPRWRPAARDPLAFASILEADPVLRDRLAMWTLGEACRDGARWLAAGAAVRVAVELPSGQLSSPSFVSMLRKLLSETGFEPTLLELELVDVPSGERDVERIATVLRTIHAEGVHVTLARVDDTCSIRELRRLPVETLRVERATLDRLGPTFLATVVAIAQALDLQVTATEIDSPAALAALEPHALDDLAGALLGASVPAAEVLGLVDPPPVSGEIRTARRVGATSSVLPVVG